MSLPIPRNFTKTSYTPSAWETVVHDSINLASILISNTTASAINVQLRIGGPNAIVLPTTSIPANTSYVLDLAGIATQYNQTLQLNASAVGIHVVATEAF